MLTLHCLALMSAVMAMTGDPAASPVVDGTAAPDESRPRDRTVTVPTALIATHLFRVELHEGLGLGVSLAVANRVQVSGVALLPVFANARAYVGQLKLRLFTVGPFTLSATVARVMFRLSASYEADIKGGALLGTYCFGSDCAVLTSVGLWYGRHSWVVDTSPGTGAGWLSSVNLLMGISPHGALLADAWFGQGSKIAGAGYRLHGRMFFADFAFVVSSDSLAAPWLNLGWGIGANGLLAGLR